jgi:hypothetical protein
MAKEGGRQMTAGWIDDNTWRIWIGRVYIGYARDVRQSGLSYLESTAHFVGSFRAVVIGRHTFAIGVMN